MARAKGAKGDQFAINEQLYAPQTLQQDQEKNADICQPLQEKQEPDGLQTSPVDPPARTKKVRQTSTNLYRHTGEGHWPGDHRGRAGTAYRQPCPSCSRQHF